MSNKMVCPGCSSYTSSIFDAFYEGKSCPHCGLSADAMHEIVRIRNKTADDELKQRCETLQIEYDKLLRRCNLAEHILESMSQHSMAAYNNWKTELSKIPQNGP